MLRENGSRWTSADSSELYDVERWGKGYFSVGSNGNLWVHPLRNPQVGIDLKDLVDRLQMRGLDLPILIRFNEIIQDRLTEIHSAFQKAIADHAYSGQYCCVFPIKVNQQRQVIQQVLEHGRRLGFGLEAGSKPEMLAVVALAEGDTPIVCNGFKDSEFIEMAMLAQKIGRNVIPVVEKYTELELILKVSERVGVRPRIGMRVKLAAKGSGRWQMSGGYRSKFGLTASEILQAFEELQRRGMADCFKLLHFHLGSQITNIRYVKGALIEAARIYADLRRRGAGLEYVDVGGGLGVDYDGSQTNFESSMNYTLQEYANDVVYHLQAVCDDAEVPHPNIISESGRAIAAYHSVLVFDVLGVSNLGVAQVKAELPEDAEQPLSTLQWTYDNLTSKNLLESYHDAQQALEMAITIFSAGHLTLDQRCLAESMYWGICHKIKRLTEGLEEVPEELLGLDLQLADTYFCNFSLFQSMPDSWAIKQLFPIMPIHRLDQQPTRQAVLGDITCDSDGKIDQFIDHRDVRRTLPLHQFEHQPYYLAAFLIGAYQEILGDMHNLFGDTNAVHVTVKEHGNPQVESIIKGDTVCEVLDYVQFSGGELLERLQAAVELAVRQELIDHKQAGNFLKFYEQGLHGYTYLEDMGEE